MGDEIKLSECRALVVFPVRDGGCTVGYAAETQQIVCCSHRHPVYYNLATRNYECERCGMVVADKRDILMMRALFQKNITAKELYDYVQQFRAEHQRRRQADGLEDDGRPDGVPGVRRLH